MPHLKSAAKRLRQGRKREAENKKLKKELKRLIKTAKGAKDLPNLYKKIDKAAKRGIFHEKKASRMKSLLSRKLGKQPE